MKKIVIIFLLSLISFTSNAQKVIEKTINYNNQLIDLDVKFATDIEVKTWDKSTVYLRSEIKTHEEKYLDLFELNIDEGSRKIRIESDAVSIFETFRKDCVKENKRDKNFCYNTGDLFKFHYVLYVPKNARFKVSSINGDLKSDVINGEFTADLINGDIEIASYSGNLDLSTINGVIDMKIVNANLVAETIHGDIFADEKLNFTSKSRHVGQKIYGNSGNGNNSLKLNTINGNMYLRL